VKTIEIQLKSIIEREVSFENNSEIEITVTHKPKLNIVDCMRSSTSVIFVVS